MGSFENNVQSHILDIGGSNLRESLLPMLQNRMLKPDEQCVLPSPLLSDDRGLALWRKINRLPGYYQTNEEVELLELYGTEIADLICPGTTLIDLGCG